MMEILSSDSSLTVLERRLFIKGIPHAW